MKMTNELFSWFKHESICPDVRALNASIFIHSTPNSIIGKECCVWRSQMSFFSLFNDTFICSDVRAWNATFYVHSTPNSIIGKEYCIWRSQKCYLADSNTSSYVLMLERWMLRFSYIQRPTVLLVRNIVYEDRKCVI